MSSDPFITLANLQMAYGHAAEAVPIFDHLDISFAKGSFTAIMGPSGSGKTTLLNLIGGIDKAQQGEIRIGDTDIARLSESALARWRAEHVGFIFQFYNLMPVLTALENVELPLLLTRLNAKERRERALAALDLVGIADRAKHKPRELSGGQQQRVAIARAIVTDPDLILADEPTGDLDRQSAISTLELLSMLNTELGKTIIMVTHDEMAAASASHILRLNKGLFLSDQSVDCTAKATPLTSVLSGEAA